MIVATGTTDVTGSFTGPGGRYAYAAPLLRFATDALWSRPAPAEPHRAAF